MFPLKCFSMRANAESLFLVDDRMITSFPQQHQYTLKPLVNTIGL